MSKKFSILFIMVLTIIVFSFFSYKFIVQSQREHLIFCDILSPGMSKDEVLNSLISFGDIKHNVSSFGSGTFVVYARFLDRNVVGSKNYNLSFVKEKYVGVSVTEFLEDTKPVCK